MQPETDARFDGPDCGIDGCAREVGHIGEHHTDPSLVTLDRGYLAGYRLPDHSMDLAAWLRDGLDVYNLFVLMKPLFFQMLDALGGDFEAPYSKINEDGKRWALTMGERVPDGGDSITDRVVFATLVDRDQSGDPAEPPA